MKKLAKNNKVVLRFAPSPTGYFHIGNARTALFNFLYARANNGKLVLRIEDTDKERSKLEFEEDLIKILSWMGINWDNKEIYRQSRRTDIYKNYLEGLIKEKKAYHCFCAEEDLEAERQEQMSRGVAPKYNGKCSNLTDREVSKRLSAGEKYIIRFRTPKKVVAFNDLIRDKIEFDSGLIGDFVISKDIETPLYNFTVVIDDYEMEITHIIRGEDHISNTPKQILLQEALGFSQPKYAHLPLILGPDGKKLSKRNGESAVRDYAESGYLPEAVVNFLVLLGWNSGDDKEIYSMQELIKNFDISRVQKSSAIFNIEKLDFINGYYIRKKSIEELAQLCLPYLVNYGLLAPEFENREIMPDLIGIGGKEIVAKYKIAETGEKAEIKFIEKTIFIYQERLKKLSEIGELADFFYKDGISYGKELLVWKDARYIEIKTILDKIKELLSDIDNKNWGKEELENVLLPEAEAISMAIRKKKDRGYVLWTFRVALTGKKSSAGPFEIAEIMGKEKTIKRVGAAIKLVSD